MVRYDKQTKSTENVDESDNSSGNSKPHIGCRKVRPTPFLLFKTKASDIQLALRKTVAVRGKS